MCALIGARSELANEFNLGVKEAEDIYLKGRGDISVSTIISCYQTEVLHIWALHDIRVVHAIIFVYEQLNFELKQRNFNVCSKRVVYAKGSL